MPSTYTLIKGETIGSSAASYTFTAIPSTFTDLVLRVSARGSVSGNTQFRLSINGVAGGTAYSRTQLIGEGSTAFSDRSSNTSSITSYALTNDSGTTTNTFNSVEIYIPSYTESQNKPISVFGVRENNSSTVNTIIANAGLWRDTTTISSLVMFPQSGTFDTGSSFYLYGISKS